MPVLPLVGSTIVVARLQGVPSCSAAATIARGNAVLHAAAGVATLQLAEDLCRSRTGHALQLHERGVADQVQDALRQLCFTHERTPLLYRSEDANRLDVIPRLGAEDTLVG